MTSSLIIVRRPSGAVATFVADEYVIDRGAVTAHGRWKDLPNRPAREYAWPAARVLEIRKAVAA